MLAISLHCNTASTIKDIIRFFRESALRRRHAPNLPPLCETLWSQKYKGIAILRRHFLEIVESLIKLSQERNSLTRASAFQLHCACTKSTFVFCICRIAKYSGILEPVINIVQSKSMNLMKCSQHIDQIISVISCHRESAEEQVDRIVRELQELCDALEINLQLRRIVKRQQHFTNTAADLINVSEYFRSEIYRPHMVSFKSPCLV